MRVVRLCKRKHPPLDGVGASITGGRWNSPGLYMVYTASCGALAIVEYLAHLSTLPKDMVLALIEIPRRVKIEKTSWAPADQVTSRQIGDEWLSNGSTAVLEVPSVLAPRQMNYLINPNHPMFGVIKIIEITPFAFESRLLSTIPAPVPTQTGQP